MCNLVWKCNLDISPHVSFRRQNFKVLAWCVSIIHVLDFREQNSRKNRHVAKTVRYNMQVCVCESMSFTFFVVHRPYRTQRNRTNVVFDYINNRQYQLLCRQKIVGKQDTTYTVRIPIFIECQVALTYARINIPFFRHDKLHHESRIYHIITCSLM